MFLWVAGGQARPPPLVVLVAAAVTSCRHHAGPAVLDGHTWSWARGSAAMVGGVGISRPDRPTRHQTWRPGP